ncbi:MAG: LrgB family protein [Gordonibacter sp.]
MMAMPEISPAFVLTALAGTLASFAAFKLSVLLYEKVKSPLLNPLLVAVACIIATLCALRIPLESYEQSVQVISFLLGPATVALAYSVYRQRQMLKEHFVPIFAGCLVGSLVSMASAFALCKLLGLDDALALSFVPKSVTTPIAIAVSEQLGGITSITVAAVIVTGIMGAICAPLMSRLFRVRNRVARGVAIGTCSHAVGTTKAIEMGELEGAMSGVSIAVSGLLTTAIVVIATCIW